MLRVILILAAIAAALVVVWPAAAQTATQQSMAPGDRLVVTCAGPIAATVTGQKVDLSCAAAIETPGPTPTPTVWPPAGLACGGMEIDGLAVTSTCVRETTATPWPAQWQPFPPNWPATPPTPTPVPTP